MAGGSEMVLNFLPTVHGACVVCRASCRDHHGRIASRCLALPRDDAR